MQAEFIERAVRAKFCGRLNKKVCDSDFFRALISAKKVAGVTRRDDVSLLWQAPIQSHIHTHYPISPPTVPEQRVCSQGIRCRHRGLPISVNCFRKSNTLPNCYLFHKQYNDCRSSEELEFLL